MTMIRHLIASLVLVWQFATLSPAQDQDLRLPSIFGNHMVLQRGRPVTVWGWGPPGQDVTVKLGWDVYHATIDDEGTWSLTVPAPVTTQALELKVTCGQQAIEFDDVHLGEVWVCSGQSNMEWPLRASDGGEVEVAKADHPRLRLFKVAKRPAEEPQSDCEGSWQVCSSETAAEFSAVAYYFGKEIMQDLDCRVGLIGTYWGGTPAQAWTSAEALQSHAVLKPLLESAADSSHRQNGASTLSNGMLQPLIPFAIRGAIWYQGEANVTQAHQYNVLFPTMIRDWRMRWRQGDFPFYFVQLAPFRYGWADPTACAELWQAQINTLSLPHTGMAVTNDIGDVQDIHPRNKRDVGDRLARSALARTYGRQDVAYSGPLYDHHEVEDDTVRVHFRHAHGGLRTRDGQTPIEFQIAGEDRQFRDAVARIEGSTVVVSSPGVARPVAVRFAWRDTAQPNLVNVHGLPASAFRTDDFAWVTE